MNRILQDINTILEYAKCGVASVAEKAAHAACCVAMIYGKSLVRLCCFANSTNASLLIKHALVILQTDAKVASKPKHALPTLHARVVLRVIPFGAFFTYSAFAIAGTLRTKEAGKWFDFPACAARLLGYNVLSHGVNLPSRFALWLGSFSVPALFEPFCILPQKGYENAGILRLRASSRPKRRDAARDAKAQSQEASKAA